MSFNKNKPAEAQAEATPEPVAEAQAEASPETNQGTVAVRPDSTVAVPQQASDDMGGQWNRGDVRLPRVNLIHKTSAGALIKKFGIGSFALAKEVKISDGETPIDVYALRSDKDYVQKLPFGSTETPVVFKTEQEVINAGGSLNYADHKNGNYFGPRAHVRLVIPLPEGASESDGDLFPYEFNDIPYAMALLTVASSAFTSVGKELATLRNNNKVMRAGLRFGKLVLTSETRTSKDLDWVVPVIKYAGATEPALAEFLQSLL